jgi:hypothetical protein
LENVTEHGLYKKVLGESFKRGQELEITGVQKNTIETWAWLVAPTPTQADKIIKFKATFRNEIIPTTIKTSSQPRNNTIHKNLKQAQPSGLAHNLKTYTKTLAKLQPK